MSLSDSTWLYRRQVSLSLPGCVHCDDAEPRIVPSAGAPDNRVSVARSEQQQPPLLPQQRYLLLRLRRPSLAVPWGLTLCRPRDNNSAGAGVVVVGDARPAAVRAALVECRERVEGLIGPGPFLPTAGNGEGTAVKAVRAYVRRLSARLRRQPPVAAAAAPLLPGDWILAIDGRCPWELASSLPELTAHLRGRRDLCLLVYRNDAAIGAAVRSLRQAEANDMRTLSAATTMTVAAPTPARRAADASYHVIRTLFPQAVTPAVVTPSPPPPQPLAPQGILSQYLPPSASLTCHRPVLPSWEVPPTARSVVHRNPLFTDSAGHPIAFDDDQHHNWEMDVMEAAVRESDRTEKPVGDDGARPSWSADDFAQWLWQRKRSWRERCRGGAFAVAPDDASVARGDCDVAVDFWSSQGDASFDDWLTRSRRRWRRSYSWNRRKRRRLEEELEQRIELRDDNFGQWLGVRKNQWLIERRKRHRRRFESMLSEGTTEFMQNTGTATVHASNVDYTAPIGQVNPDVAIVDAILEEQEKWQKALRSRDPLDLAVFVDRKRGLPDDIVAHTIGFLQPMERPTLLAISRKIRRELCNRQEVWRQLCESHWKVPRRPRKPWHEIYFDMHRIEVERSKIKVDALLTRAADILFKGDNLQAIEKLVTTAEQNDAFDVNYSSGVVCERNSILNLAVIHRRHKVVRWLVESKHADIETCDRGRFTPLMNAAWAGDRYLVRFFMQKGADRWKQGTSHYTKPLAAPDFQGWDAAGWAEKRGHFEIATLIRLGL